MSSLNKESHSSEFEYSKSGNVVKADSSIDPKDSRPSDEIHNITKVGTFRVRSVKDHSEEILQSLLQYNDEMKEYILEWKTGSLMSTADLKDRLEYLVLLKRRVLGQVTDSKVWVEKFLLQPTIKEFLLSIFVEKKVSQDVKSILQEIVSRKDISFICTQDFPEISQISSSLYQSEHDNEMLSIACKKIDSFPSFVSFLKSILEKEKHSHDQMPSKVLAKLVSQGIYNLRFPYRNTYNDILIIVLTYPFLKESYSSNIIAIQHLSITDLEYLISFFSVEHNNKICYEKKGTACLQAYLLLLAVCASADKGNSVIMFLKQVCQLMQEAQPSLDSNISGLTNEYLHGGSLQDLMEKLQRIVVEPCEGRIYRNLKELSENGAKQNRLEIIRKSFTALSYCDDEFAALCANPEVHEVLEQLGLCKYYQKKLKIQDALSIRPESLELSLQLKDITDLKQLPLLVLHKLMSYDCLCRADLFSLAQKNKKSVIQSNTDSDSDGVTDSSDSENDCNSNGKVDVKFNIHPIDCLLSLLLCSDDILRQDLLSRLAKCQFAIPFILPEPFLHKLTIPLWAMRSIIKEWKSIDEVGSLVPHTGPIVDYKMPIISFVRIGTHTKNTLSKSKILNDVISDAHHDYFFHRDCRGGQFHTKLGSGLVDMCWYLPSGNPTDSFSDAITFMNLHGDAKNFELQFSFLSKISSMCIILLNDESVGTEDPIMPCLNSAYALPGGIVLLNSLEKKPKHLKQHFPKAFVIQLSSKSSPNKTAAEIKDAIRERIQSKLSKMQEHKVSIEQACYLKEKEFKIDEESDEYREGFEHAENIREMITSSTVKKSSIKEHMLPLQGKDLWKAWALNDKEMHRQVDIGKMSIHDYTEKIKNKKRSIRNDQLEKVANLSPVMSTFIESLMKLGGSKNYCSRNFFLQILKLELNCLSRECISEKQLDYQITRKELSKLQATASSQNEELEDNTKRLQQKLEALQEDIINTAFGLEHLFRELGQVYEACLHGKNYCSSKYFKIDYYTFHLPRLAAELLIEGYPLELMDGDAAHVPLQWVIAVVKETADLLKDPKVFVMSVLGLQSTGKSTMLNTAFGLQFNVSAGRCTRGAYMQLLKLDEALLTKTKCKYILVVDTEGLRAPELDPLKTQKHDNELATFVIGLANMTLINIYGEVPGDMDDILQTSVHAFLRMKEVKYYPSCQFVHQNAGVNIKGEVGRAKFTQKLDQFTIDAAREEDCEGKFKTFNNVIKFNDQSDVHYFPGLWKGDLPMAPVNEGYSQTAQYLKYQLIRIITKRAGLVPSTEEMIGNLDFSSFHVKIKDLWKTLLREKFVFSFKNTLEITAYNSLETAYGKWDWQLQSAMLKWEQEAENEIRTEPLETVGALVEQKCKKLRYFVMSTLYQPLQVEMEEFFNGKRSEILIQWKKRFEIRLETLAKDLIDHAERHCTKLLQGRQAITTFQKNIQENEAMVNAKMQEQILSVKRYQEELQESLEKRDLNPAQLQQLLRRNLFSVENLLKYLEERLISECQFKEIEKIINSNCGILTKESLKELLQGEVLTLSQVKTIIKHGQFTKEEIEAQFEEIWNKLILQLPLVKSATQVSVTYEIEKALMTYVDRQGRYGQMIAKVQEHSWNEWGCLGEFYPVKNIHFVHSGGIIENVKKFGRNFFGRTDPHEIQAIEITKEVFTTASAYVDEVTKEDTDFKVAFVYKLLRLVDEEIAQLSNAKSCYVKFQGEYYLDVYARVCGDSISKFEEMVRAFEERNDPRLNLEKKVKGPLLTQFKNQYNQTVAEQAIADAFFAYLEEPIKIYIQKSLALAVVTKMKPFRYFTSKMALKAKVLEDLYHENSFDSCMKYVESIQEFLKKKIVKLSGAFSDEKISSNETRLQNTVKEEVEVIIKCLTNVVIKRNETVAQDWLQAVCSDKTFRQKLGITLKADDILVGYKSLKTLNVEGFQKNIKGGLKWLEKKTKKHFSNITYSSFSWKGKLPSDYCMNLIGCTEQCPFCKEHCDLLKHNTKDKGHQTEVHRVICLAGWRYRRNDGLAVHLCPDLVGSKYSFNSTPCKDYQKVYPTWSIIYDSVSKSCSFWKWFVGTYQQQLKSKFGASTSIDIPESWSQITWKEIKEDLKSAYNI